MTKPDPSIFEAKLGRPATGRNPSVHFTVPRDVLAEVDRIAAESFESRPAVLVSLIRLGLDSVRS